MERGQPTDGTSTSNPSEVGPLIDYGWPRAAFHVATGSDSCDAGAGLRTRTPRRGHLILSRSGRPQSVSVGLTFSNSPRTKAALAKADVPGPMRLFHAGRHTSISNASLRARSTASGSGDAGSQAQHNGRVCRLVT